MWFAHLLQILQITQLSQQSCHMREILHLHKRAIANIVLFGGAFLPSEFCSVLEVSELRPLSSRPLYLSCKLLRWKVNWAPVVCLPRFLKKNKRPLSVLVVKINGQVHTSLELYFVLFVAIPVLNAKSVSVLGKSNGKSRNQHWFKAMITTHSKLVTLGQDLASINTIFVQDSAILNPIFGHALASPRS